MSKTFFTVQAHRKESNYAPDQGLLVATEQETISAVEPLPYGTSRVVSKVYIGILGNLEKLCQLGYSNVISLKNSSYSLASYSGFSYSS